MAKRHPLLAAIEGELRGAHVSGVFDIMGHKYHLHSLSPQEETWASEQVHGDSDYSAAVAIRAPVLAAALDAVDDVAVAELFPFDQESESVRKVLSEDEALAKAWRRTAVLGWLTSTDMHGSLLRELYAKYTELDRARQEALIKLDPLARKTTTGGSSDT